MIGRELELHCAAETLAAHLAPDEREFLDERAAENNAYALQFAENAWWYRHETDRAFTPAMRAYHRALSDLQDHRAERRQCHEDWLTMNPGDWKRKWEL